MQSTAGLIDDIIFFAIFIFLTFLVSGKVKLGESNQARFDSLIERKGTFLKILVYVGTGLFALLILIRIIEPKVRRQVNSSNLQTAQVEWTKADKEAMTKACIESTKESYQKDSVATISLCECVTEKFASKFTYGQIEELNKKPQNEQLDSVIPLIKSCRAELNLGK